MYLKQIKIENYGAIEKLHIESKFDENNDPLPILLVGKNGAGKTLLLANIADSLIEAKKQCYEEIQETKPDKYFKLGKKDYILSGRDYSYVYAEYQGYEVIEKYTDFINLLDYNIFVERYNEVEFEGLNKTDSKFWEHGFYKKLKINPFVETENTLF